MVLNDLFKWIYQVPETDLCRYLIIGTLVLFWVHRRMETRRLWRCMLAAALIVWFAATFYITVLDRGGSGSGLPQLIPFHSYREAYATQNRDILRSSFMNLLLFYPAGLLLSLILPCKWSRGHQLLVVTRFFALYSLSIELLQYAFCLGQAEIDDLIHNILGAVLGNAAVAMLPRLFSQDVRK